MTYSAWRAMRNEETNVYSVLLLIAMSKKWDQGGVTL
jgi:hypothetical protein